MIISAAPIDGNISLKRLSWCLASVDGVTSDAPCIWKAIPLISYSHEPIVCWDFCSHEDEILWEIFPHYYIYSLLQWVQSTGSTQICHILSRWKVYIDQNMVLRSYCRHDENSDTDMATYSLWIGLLVASPQSDLVSDIKILWYVFLQLNNQTVNLHFYSYCDVTSKNFTFLHVAHIHTYMFVNFDALGQASDFRIERRQVVFLCWMQDSKLGSLRHRFASRLNAHSQTGWAIEDQVNTWTQQPVPMISEHSAHSTSLPIGFRTWFWRYTCLLLILMLWHRRAIFESKENKLSSSAECAKPSVSWRVCIIP